MAWCNEICVESAVKSQPTNQSTSVVFMSTRSSLCNPTHSLIYEQQIWGLPYVQCTKNCPTCENYIANYKIFQEHQLNSTRFPLFPGAISNSRRFPGVVEDTLPYISRLSSTQVTAYSLWQSCRETHPCDHWALPPTIRHPSSQRRGWHRQLLVWARLPVVLNSRTSPLLPLTVNSTATCSECKQQYSLFPFYSLCALWGVMCLWFDFWFQRYIYCLLVYIVCFPICPFFFTFSLIISCLTYLFLWE